MIVVFLDARCTTPPLPLPSREGGCFFFEKTVCCAVLHDGVCFAFFKKNYSTSSILRVTRSPSKFLKLGRTRSRSTGFGNHITSGFFQKKHLLESGCHDGGCFTFFQKKLLSNRAVTTGGALLFFKKKLLSNRAVTTGAFCFFVKKVPTQNCYCPLKNCYFFFFRSSWSRCCSDMACSNRARQPSVFLGRARLASSWAAILSLSIRNCLVTTVWPTLSRLEKHK
jgi:hypothetical protein